MKAGNSTPPTVAKALASALAKRGVVSDEPERAPDHWKAAERAYLMTGAGRTIGDFRSLARSVQTRKISRSAFYRRLSVYCDCARTHLDMTDPDFQEVVFAWGYFSALAKKTGASEADASSET